MPQGVAPNDIFRNGVWYNRSGGGGIVTSEVDSVTGVLRISAGATDDVLTPASLDGKSVIKQSIGRIGTALFEPGNGITPTASAGAGVTIGSSGFTTDTNGERVFTVTATGISGTNNYFEINIPAFEPLTADAASLEWWMTPSIAIAPTLYIGTAGYAIFATRSLGLFLGLPVTSDPFVHYGLQSANINPADWTKNNYTGNTSDQAWTVAKLRVPVANGSTLTFSLRSLRVGTVRGKGRICVVSDDGYASWLRLGAPICEYYGIKTTCAVIADRVGKSTLYGSLAAFKEYVSRGNECVAHGPIGGVGNLIANYSTNAERVADMNYHRDYLLNNGLVSADGAKCYVWPQGEYSPTIGDPSLLNAARAAGYSVGRAATVKQPFFVQLRSLSSLAHQKLIMPIIGHAYAGATATADDAAETTNIAGIVSNIQALGAARADGYIMLHKVVARGAATAGQIEIEADRLKTIMAAIRVEMDAGRLEPVGMSEFV